MTSSVLIPSYRRPAHLKRCLRSLTAQTAPPTEVIVVWQGDDTPTREAAEAFRQSLPLIVLHSREAGVVPAENLALDRSTGEIILLIDDDAEAPPGWVERHVSLYRDPKVGAAGGPADNFHPDGTPFPRRAVTPIGQLTASGKVIGNMYDQVEEWRQLAPVGVDHLVGYNFSLRRVAFDRFEAGLKPYWQMFELEACLQVSRAGYRVMFDYSNVVRHNPTNTAYVAGRHGDLTIKVYNNAYNHAFVLARHSPANLRLRRLVSMFAVGSVASPGLAAFFVACVRYRNPLREFSILLRTWRSRWQGWQAGSRAPMARVTAPPVSSRHPAMK